MKKFCAGIAGVVGLAALAACSDAPVSPYVAPSGSADARLAPGTQDPVVTGEVLVNFREGADAGALLRANGLVRKALGYHGRFEILGGPPGQERALAAALRNAPGVEWAEPNYIRHVDRIDPRLWAFYNPGGLSMSFYNDPNGLTGPLPSSYASHADADEDNVEGYAAGGSPVVIGSIDTGVDFGHPEFTGRLIRGCDWYSQGAAGDVSGTCSDFTPDDTPDEGHGTHTTGTMAGSTVGVAGVSGAASNVQVYVQRVCGPAGCYTSSIANAIYAAADYPGMVAMNLSLGGLSESSAEQSAIQYATGKNVLVIAAAGNDGQGQISCPACDANAISVASTTWQDQLAPNSNYGSGLSISAPGGACYSNTTEEGCIFSAVVSGYTGGQTYTGPLSGGSYAYMLGTSMAAPQVTGTAAIVASKLGLRGSALKDRLLGTADDLGAAGYDATFGNGRLNSYRAVTGTTLDPANDPSTGSSGGSTDTQAPAPPTSLGATAVSSSQIDLSWTASPESDLDHYNVYRATSSGTYGSTPLASVLKATSFSSTGLAAGATYYYVVTAVDASGNESSHSAETSATTPTCVTGGKDKGGKCH